MVDIDTLRNEILKIVRNEGPILPVQVSRKLGKDTIFAGAVLSELVKKKQISISNAKVGGSPVYYADGQETKLDLLYTYLPSKEKEAYELLRKNQIIKDKDCDPPIRIALRSIKDFSIPLEINGEVYWRWYLTLEEEAKSLINQEKPQIKIKQEIKKPEKQTIQLQQDIGDEFSDTIRNYLKTRNISVFSIETIRKKREIVGRIRINSDLGPLDYIFLAKNKKKINEADLSLAQDVGRKNKLPVLFLSNGEISKKSIKYLEENLRGRVLYRKIK